VKHGRTQGLILRTVIWIENWANLASFFFFRKFEIHRESLVYYRADLRILSDAFFCCTKLFFTDTDDLNRN